MLRTASARPRPTAHDGAVTSAGTSIMVASSAKSRMPKSRATIEASTRTPSEGRLLRAGTAVSATGLVAPTAWGVTRAELFESLGRPLQDIDDLRVAFTPGPGADDVPGCEDRHPRELHESSLAPSLCRLSEEIPALPAVRPTRPPAVIKAAFFALPEPMSGRPDLMPLGTSSDLLTGSRSRCSRLFLLKSRIGSPPFTAWYETPSRSPRRARPWSSASVPRHRCWPQARPAPACCTTPDRRSWYPARACARCPSRSPLAAHAAARQRRPGPGRRSPAVPLRRRAASPGAAPPRRRRARLRRPPPLAAWPPPVSPWRPRRAPRLALGPPRLRAERPRSPARLRRRPPAAPPGHPPRRLGVRAPPIRRRPSEPRRPAV